MIAITGATGTLGRALLARMSGSGAPRVRLLVRTPVEAPAGHDVVSLDLERPATIRGRLDGIDGVIHLAARVREGPIEDTGLLAELDRVNVAGTRELLDEARRAGVRRFLHVSSYTVHDTRPDGLIDESTPARPRTAYGLSKLRSEEAVRETLAGSDLEWIIVRPVLVASGHTAPGDVLAEMVRFARRGLFPLPAEARRARKPLITLDDVTTGLLAAWERGRPGETYILSGASFALEDLLRHIGKRLGRRPHLPVPLVVLQALARLSGTLLEPLGLPAPLNRRRVDKLLRDQTFSLEKARTHLGFEPTSRDLAAYLDPYLGPDS